MSGALRVERLALDGAGVSGGVRVPGALPGERVVAGEVVEPSPHRVEPGCPHYGACGGCAVMHASDRLVASWKADVVRRALAARGLDAEIAGVATSPPASRRRATLSGRRLGRGAVGGPPAMGPRGGRAGHHPVRMGAVVTPHAPASAVVGFHGRASGTVTAIPGCRLLLPSLTAAIPACEALTALGASRRGELSLALTDAPEGVDVAVTGGRPLDGPLRERLAGVAREAGLSRLSWDGEVAAQAAPPTQRFGAARVVPPPGAFLQATRQGEAALLAVIRMGVEGAARIADLFSGCGTFALPMASAAQVHAVEAQAPMLAALDAGWRGARGLRRMTTEARDLFRRPLAGDELVAFDAVVMDPPRAGAEAQARALAEAGPPTVVSVSCDPATFARDAAIMVAGGYRLGPAHVVDQFRWSPHVELVSVLSR